MSIQYIMQPNPLDIHAQLTRKAINIQVGKRPENTTSHFISSCACWSFNHRMITFSRITAIKVPPTYFSHIKLLQSQKK